MRKGAPKKRELIGDNKFSNIEIGRFINYVMRKGKKTIAERVVYDALDIVQDRLKQDPIVVFDQAVKNVSPLIEVKSRRVGGANYQIPSPVIGGRKFFLAARWLINAAKVRKGKPMREKLAEELMDAFSGVGGAVKKKQDVHKMADANKAFAHFLRYGKKK
jgi:small subunit ribosomal protein S7